MENLLKFIASHLNDDPSRLILDRDRYHGIDMELAVNCIESRRKLKGKVNEWHGRDDLIFPLKLSAEQCSSSATGRYKAELASRICGSNGCIADLTGGLGVDSWFFSKKFGKVIYIEMQEVLCNAARHNFKMLGAENIEVFNSMVTPGKCLSAVGGNGIMEGNVPDIVYIDPARRGDGGRKVFLIEECTPDVLTLKDEIFTFCRHILLKLSPMADISMVCGRLGRECREIHVVAAGGECKELLIWMDREWQEEYTVTAAEIQADMSVSIFAFSPTEESKAVPRLLNQPEISGQYIFEPGKALMKSGAFCLMSERFGIEKIGTGTHYYMTDDAETAENLKKHGKVFRVLDCRPLDKRSMKETGKTYTKADVTARNIPMESETLRKRLGVQSGNGIHIFGLKSDSAGNLLIVCERED